MSILGGRHQHDLHCAGPLTILYTVVLFSKVIISYGLHKSFILVGNYELPRRKSSWWNFFFHTGQNVIQPARWARAKNGSSTKIGVIWQKSDFLAKNRNFGPKKRRSLFSPWLFGQRQLFSLNNFFRSWPEHGESPKVTAFFLAQNFGFWPKNPIFAIRPQFSLMTHF